MCYGYKLVKRSDGGWDSILPKDYVRLLQAGKVVETYEGAFYAKDTVPVILNRDGQLDATKMRWDLIPRNYLKREKLTTAEVIKKKNSRAKNPKTGRPWGFSSFNARVETIETLPSFRDSWHGSRRCILPCTSFFERPNMENAPPEFKGKEYEIELDGVYYMAGIWDAWESHEGEVLESCTVITLSSEGHSLMRSIWHERIPAILGESMCEVWLDPKTNPMDALEFCKQLEPNKMRVKPKEPRLPKEGDE